MVVDVDHVTAVVRERLENEPGFMVASFTPYVGTAVGLAIRFAIEEVVAAFNADLADVRAELRHQRARERWSRCPHVLPMPWDSVASRRWHSNACRQPWGRPPEICGLGCVPCGVR